MKVLVTGAGGFLGRHLVARLLARGDAVAAVDLHFDPPLPEGAEMHRASVADSAAMARAARGCEGLIHGAAVTGLWARDPAIFEAVNHQGTRVVLAEGARAGIARAVLVSSYVTLISGRRADPPRIVDETLELPPEVLLGPYPRSKRLAELAACEGPLKAAIVQPSAPIGPGDGTPTSPGALLRDLANGRLPALIDCGWNFVDVRALAAGVLAALDGGAPGRRYLMAGQDWDTAGLVARFERIAGVPGPRARVPHGVALIAAHLSEGLAGLIGNPPGAPLTGVRLAGPRIGFDTARARAELGFAPGDAATALRDALLWMRAQGWLTRPLPGLDSQN